MQRVSGDELIIRVMKVYCDYRKEEVPKLSVYESTWIFVRRDTPWQYSQLKQFYLFDKEPMATALYLKALLEYPQLEMLFKMGFYKLTCDLVYRSSPKGLLECAG